VPSAARSIRILLIDDHVLVRQGVRMLLEMHADLAVVGEAATLTEARLLAVRERPSIVVLEPALCGPDLRSISELKALGAGVKILLLTALGDTEQHRLAIRSGASGVVLKQQASDVLVKAVRRVHAGEVWADRGTTARVLQDLWDGPARPDPGSDAARIASLTVRERQIVALVARGFSTNKIADRLCIADKTVRNHLASIYAKLNVSDRLELALFAVKHQLTAAPPASE
jgi:DNA-binding NarL/FixJ family response regulator